MTGSLRRLCDTAVSSRCDAFYTDDGRGRRGASMNLAQAACVHARRRTGPPIPFPALVGTVTNYGSAARRIRIANWNKSNFTEPCKIYARSISIPPFEENFWYLGRNIVETIIRASTRISLIRVRMYENIHIEASKLIWNSINILGSVTFATFDERNGVIAKITIRRLLDKE